MKKIDKIKIDFMIKTYNIDIDIENIEEVLAYTIIFDRYFIIRNNEIINKADLINELNYYLSYKI